MAGDQGVAQSPEQMVAGMRMILALSALLIIIVDPSEPDRHVALTYAGLSLYAAYSVLLYLLAMRRPSEVRAKAALWIDVAAYTALVALSSGTSSIFFFFYLFAALQASFGGGYWSGIAVTSVSALLFTVVGLLVDPQGPGFTLNRFLLRPTYLLVLGYLMAYWGGREIDRRRRLELLQDVARVTNLRLGLTHTIATLLERVLRFCDATECLLVEQEEGGYAIQRARADGRGGAGGREALPEALGQELLSLPPALALAYRTGAGLGRAPTCEAWDTDTGEPLAWDMEACEGLAARLEAASLITVPVSSGQTRGRLYVAAAHRRLRRAEAEFLLQVTRHVMPVLENIRLVDRLALDAAGRERQRIAHDLHDTIIQPYVALRLGLSALVDRAARGEAVEEEARRLLAMSDEGVSELRAYVRGLTRESEAMEPLGQSLRRFAERFSLATGIAVEVEAELETAPTDRLSIELLQMVVEALSNARRHARCSRARVWVGKSAGALALQVENDDESGQERADFTPRSIAGRASALGGRVWVTGRPGGGSVVRVEIPL